MENAITTYWAAYSSERYAASASLMHPDDLAMMQKHLLPLFIQASTGKHASGSRISAIFFEGIKESERVNMTGEQVFAGIARVVARADPRFEQSVKGSGIAIDEIRFLSDSEAQVRYRTTGRPTSMNITDVLRADQGVWYMRVRVPVEVTVSRMREALGL